LTMERSGKALTLEWPDVHWTPAAGGSLGYLRVLARHGENSKAPNVPLTERAVEVSKTRGPARTGYVFQVADGQPIYQTWLNRQHSALRRLLELAVEFVPHSFRHTYGTRLGESGADAFTIMRLMGHSSVTVSQEYVHPSPETMERAVQRLHSLRPRARDGGLRLTACESPYSRFGRGPKNVVSLLFSSTPGWRNRQTQRT